MLDRYDRQNMIPGWNQNLLREAKVAVIGSGYLSAQVLLGLAGLGAGDIMVVDNGRKTGMQPPMQFFTGPDGNSNSEHLEGLIRRINPDIHVTGLHWKFYYLTDTAVLSDRTLIIDATNDPASKYHTLTFAKSRGIPAIVAAANEVQADVQVCSSGEHDESLVQRAFAEALQGILPSGVAAGFVLDRARKYLLPLPDDQDFTTPLNYDLLSTDRFPQELAQKGVLPQCDFASKTVLIVGAGSLGNIVSIQMAMLGMGRVYIADYDLVESVNLNRQLLLYERLGEPKAAVLTERLAEINPGATYIPVEQRIELSFAEYLNKHKPDIVLDCVDNFRTRATLDYFAKRLGIPLVSGGTDFKSGQVVTYVPGQTACLECQLDISKYAEAELAREAEHCTAVPEPSVIISNQIIGNLMAAEAFATLAKWPGLRPVQGSIKYDSNSAQSIGAVGLIGPCECHLKSEGDVLVR